MSYKAVCRSHADFTKFGGRLLRELGENWEKPYTVVMTRFYRPKSNDQNAKFHAMCNDLALHIGHSNGDVKEFIKMEYGPAESIIVGDRVKLIPKSIAKYTVAEMIDVIDQLYRIGAELSVEWSDPTNLP